MTRTDLDSYRQRLLLALRRHDVPGPRIGEAIAEVESHVAESGEDPVTAFGDPDAYAGRLSRELGLPARRRTVRWANAAVAAVAFASCGLVTSALIGDGPLRPRLAAAAAGLAAFGALIAWLVRHQRRAQTRVIDPRTGTDLRFPAPRWAIVTFAACLGAMIVIMILVR